MIIVFQIVSVALKPEMICRNVLPVISFSGAKSLELSGSFFHSS